MAFPRRCKPLVIPLLAHSGFKQAVKGFLREQIKNLREHLVPFHLPSIQVVAGKTESITDVLYNHLYMQQSWSRTQHLHNVPVEHYLRIIQTYKWFRDMLHHQRDC